jgi:hypothetical protein
VSLLNFSDSGQKPAGRRKPLRAILGIGALVGAVTLGSTLAASINLNDSGPVEFGQGIAQTVACSGNDSIIVTPTSSFINADGAGAYYFTSVTLSSIPSGCIGADFTIAAYDNSGNIMRLASDVCSDTGTKPIINFQGSPATNHTTGSDNEMHTIVSNKSATAFTVSWIGGVNDCQANAIAADVYRITIESSGAATGAVIISCDSIPNDAPSYYPCGPQQNIPISTITNAGWTQCYSEDFGADMGEKTIDPILQSCTGTYLIFAGKESTGSTALLMAAGPRASISLETPLNTPNSINGSWWYYTKEVDENDGSFGFAGSQSIDQSSCDIGDDDETSPFRYCLHLNDNLYGGFRIGTLGTNREALNLNDGPTDYLKVVYQYSQPS